MDDIIGILHLRDAAMLARKAEFREQEIRKVPGLLREAAFIPETKKIDSLFKEMQSEKIHMEIVVDEYGQTAGLVTMEDILEEIVGNIMDEYDEEEHYMTEREDGSWLISGLAPFDEVSEALKLSLGEDEEEYDTLNGFLTSRLDRIPAEGEKPSIDQSGWHFQVLTIGNKKIESVLAKKLLEDRKNRMNEEGMETNDETADDPHGRNAP
jgi:putative hemolysin